MKLSIAVYGVLFFLSFCLISCKSTTEPEGTLNTSSEKILFTYKVNNQSDVWKINPDGTNAEVLINWPGSNEYGPVPSPDGSRIAFISNKNGTPQLWVANSDGSQAVQITTNAPIHTGPEWSPDGLWLYYSVSITTLNTDIYKIKIDGTQRTAIRNGSTYEYSPAVDPVNGKYLVYKFDSGAWGPTAISKRLDMTTGVEMILINCTDAAKYGCNELRYSPDGSKIAFTRDLGTGYPGYGGPSNIHIMAEDGSNWVKLTTLTANGHLYRHPTWSPDSKKLVFSYDTPLDFFQDYLCVINSDGTGSITKLTIGLGGQASDPYWGKLKWKSQLDNYVIAFFLSPR